MIKRILKFIFPRLFLKKSFLVFNTMKIKTWDKMFFPEKSVDKSEYEIFEERNPFTLLNIEEKNFLEEVKKGIKLWKRPDWKQDQYLLRYKKPAFIEPKVGWAVTAGNLLIYPSLGFSRAPFVHKPNVVEAYLKLSQVVRLDRVISLRDTGEENYFHFFNDVIAKIFFLKDIGTDFKLFTILISKNLFTKEYFQYYYQNTWLSGLNWFIQDNEWIWFKEAIFCKPFTHTKKFFDEAVSLLPQPSTSKQERKIFLTRNKSTLRFIENIKEVSSFLIKEGYEVIDSGVLPFAEQVRLFNETRYIVAVHGAGITNIIFRRNQKLSLLEVFPPGEYVPFHYIMLAKMYGFKYDAIIGNLGDKRNGGIRVNISQLKERLPCRSYY